MKKNECPVCNGLTTLSEHCPKCSNLLIDNGRYIDLFDDYSPYRPIDDIKMTDGLKDVKNHLCPHQVTCDQCGYTEIKFVTEI